MGDKEKVLHPMRVTQSGQEANKKLVAKAAGVRSGKHEQTKRAKAERATVLQEKEELFKSTINIIIDEVHKKFNGVRVTGPQTAVTLGLLAFLRGNLGPDMPVALFTRIQPNPEADWWRDK